MDVPPTMLDGDPTSQLEPGHSVTSQAVSGSPGCLGHKGKVTAKLGLRTGNAEFGFCPSSGLSLWTHCRTLPVASWHHVWGAGTLFGSKARLRYSAPTDCTVLKVKNKLLLARFWYLAYSSVSFCMFILGRGVLIRSYQHYYRGNKLQP